MVSKICLDRDQPNHCDEQPQARATVYGRAINHVRGELMVRAKA